MSLWSSAAHIYDAVIETQGALAAATAVLRDGGSPMKALRAATNLTANTVDDQVIDEVENAMRRGIEVLAMCSRAAVTVSDALGDPRVVKTLDRVIGGAIQAGWHAGRVRNLLEVWLKEDAP